MANGLLSGKYARDNLKGKGRLSGSNPFGDAKFTDRSWAILQALHEVADAVGCTPAQAAIAGSLTWPDQLTATVQASDMRLDAQTLKPLKEASASEPEFGNVDVMAGTGRVVFGGHAAQGGQPP